MLMFLTVRVRVLQDLAVLVAKITRASKHHTWADQKGNTIFPLPVRYQRAMHKVTEPAMRLNAISLSTNDNLSRPDAKKRQDENASKCNVRQETPRFACKSTTSRRRASY